MWRCPSNGKLRNGKALRQDLFSARPYVVCSNQVVSRDVAFTQARLEEARNALAEEALAYYPEVRVEFCARCQRSEFASQTLPDLKADVKKSIQQQEYAALFWMRCECLWLIHVLFRYGGSGVLRQEQNRNVKEKESISFSGKAMLHLLRARLAPPRLPLPIHATTKNHDSKLHDTEEVIEGAKAGALSKVFKLWSKDSGEGQSRAKKKLATVR